MFNITEKWSKVSSNMFGISIFELMVIAVAALIFVGPKKLPELMRQGGKLFVQIRRQANDVKSQFDGVIQQAEEEIRKVEREKFLKLLEVQQELHKPVDAGARDPKDDHPTDDYPISEYVPFEEPVEVGTVTAEPSSEPMAAAGTAATQPSTAIKKSAPSFDTPSAAVSAPAAPLSSEKPTDIEAKKQDS